MVDSAIANRVPIMRSLPFLDFGLIKSKFTKQYFTNQVFGREFIKGVSLILEPKWTVQLLFRVVTRKIERKGLS